MIDVERLNAWLNAPETERLEFKEAKHSYDKGKLHKYCAALANEGGGHFVLGVTDKRPRQVVGSAAFHDLDKVKADLTTALRLRIEASAIEHPNGRVVVLTVPARPIGWPISVDGAYLMRSGESLVAMTPDQLKRIFAEGQPDFSNEVCAGASIDDLDKVAVDRFRDLWSQKLGRAIAGSDAQLLEDAELTIDGGVTNAALVLLGTARGLGRHLPSAEIIYHFRASEQSVRPDQRVEYRQGFLSIDRALWQLVQQRNTVHSFLDGLQQRSIPTFNEEAFREALLNAVCHRDYRNQSSVVLDQYTNRLVVTSPGGFPDGVNAENILLRQHPRNRRLAEALSKCGLVERAGQGADLMFANALKEGKAAPMFRSDAYAVELTLDGRVLDDGFRRFLEVAGKDVSRSFSTRELVVLDATRREKKVDAIFAVEIQNLISLGVIERAARSRLILGRKYHRLLGTSGAYTRQKGLGRAANLALLEQHIKEHGGCQLSELCSVLPSFSERQVQSLLRELQETGRAHVRGRTKAGKWHFGPAINGPS